MKTDRRHFLAACAAGLGVVGCAGDDPAPTAESPSAAPRLERDRVAFITDEYSADLAEAIEFAKRHQLEHIEIRGLWGTYALLQERSELERARKMLDDAGLDCVFLNTPILKCPAPGVEPTERSRGEMAKAQNSFPIPDEEQFGRQGEFLERAIQAAEILGTDMLRCFSFWRTAEPESAYPLLLEKLEELAATAGQAGVKLAMENEHACNVADCAEAMRVLPQAPSNVGVLWDVLNGASTGETPYPDGYEQLDKARILHVQLKDADLSAGREQFRYCAVGDGAMRYPQVFSALARDGYPGFISMETHFQIEGDRKAASEKSMLGILAALDQQA